MTRKENISNAEQINIKEYSNKKINRNQPNKVKKLTKEERNIYMNICQSYESNSSHDNSGNEIY